MREIRLYGSEGGGTSRFSLPLYILEGRQSRSQRIRQLT